jgi:hypothetical protein
MTSSDSAALDTSDAGKVPSAILLRTGFGQIDRSAQSCHAAQGDVCSIGCAGGDAMTSSDSAALDTSDAGKVPSAPADRVLPDGDAGQSMNGLPASSTCCASCSGRASGRLIAARSPAMRRSSRHFGRGKGTLGPG